MRLNDLTPQEAEHVLKKLQELVRMDGWSILKKIMATEREDFFRKAAAPNSPITPTIFDYNRGIIEGTYRLADLPDKAIKVLETNIKLDTINKQDPSKPLTAAPKNDNTPLVTTH